MRMMLFLLLMLSLTACSAGADTCRLEKLAELPLKLVNSVPVATVQINGRPADLVLDTGSDRSVLSRAAARRLGVAEGGGVRQLRAAGGVASAASAVVGTMVLGGAGGGAGGGIRLTKVPVLVADGPDPPLDGLLGIDVMVDYEMELDVPHRRASFYRARSCATALPDWTGRIIRLPAQQQAGSGHLFVATEIDGQPLRGLLDSGATGSTLSLQAAEDAGLHGRALARLPRLRGQALNVGGLIQQRTRFRELRIGNDTIENPEVTVADLPPFAGDLLVGEDYIGTRRLWFWFLLGRVFVSPQ